MGYKWGKLGTSLSELANVFADAYPAYRNYTKCDTWEKIVSSHKEADNKRVIKIEDTFGLVLILFAGLVFACMTMFAHILHKICKQEPSKCLFSIKQLKILGIQLLLYLTLSKILNTRNDDTSVNERYLGGGKG